MAPVKKPAERGTGELIMLKRIRIFHVKLRKSPVSSSIKNLFPEPAFKKSQFGEVTLNLNSKWKETWLQNFCILHSKKVVLFQEFTKTVDVQITYSAARFNQ